MDAYKLDTGNDGCDEVLFGESEEDVTADVLHHHDLDEMPEHWSLSLLYCGIESAPPCDANTQHMRFEAYDAHNGYARNVNRYVGAADTFEDVLEYGGCCEHALQIVDTQ